MSRSIYPPSPLRALFSFALVLLSACGGGGGGGNDPTDVEDPELAPLVGTWTATEFRIMSSVNPDVVVDLVADGGSFAFSVSASGAYTATLTLLGVSRPESGRIAVSGASLTLQPNGGQPAPATWQVSGSTLILDGTTEFDFNLDGSAEPAFTHIVLQKS